MLWSPSGPTVQASVDPAAAVRFVPLTSGNLGGVARIVAQVAGSFTLGGASVLNTMQIPLAPGQDIFIAYGSEVTHISAGQTWFFCTPGIARP